MPLPEDAPEVVPSQVEQVDAVLDPAVKDLMAAVATIKSLTSLVHNSAIRMSSDSADYGLDSTDFNARLLDLATSRAQEIASITEQLRACITRLEGDDMAILERDFHDARSKKHQELIEEGDIIHKLARLIKMSKVALKEAKTFDDAVQICRDLASKDSRILFHEGRLGQLQDPSKGVNIRRTSGDLGGVDFIELEKIDQHTLKTFSTSPENPEEELRIVFVAPQVSVSNGAVDYSLFLAPIVKIRGWGWNHRLPR